VFNTNDTKFTPPAEESWWLVRAQGKEIYSFAKTAYFAVANARYPNGHSCGWTTMQQDLEVKLILEPSEIKVLMQQMK